MDLQFHEISPHVLSAIMRQLTVGFASLFYSTLLLVFHKVVCIAMYLNIK